MRFSKYLKIFQISKKNIRIFVSRPMATGTKTSLKRLIRAASNSSCRAYSNSFISSNIGKLFWSWILKDCIKVQEKKKKFTSSTQREIRQLSRCSHATTAKTCKKKEWCTCKMHVKLLFCQNLNLLLFCRSRCLRRFRYLRSRRGLRTGFIKTALER